jgi:NAD(P)-dependent dehydrogenase (short-subunit alcohol dehydrogenase family)
VDSTARIIGTCSGVRTQASAASARSRGWAQLGRPSDLAAAVAFLLSDDAEWINGQVWAINGGANMRA